MLEKFVGDSLPWEGLHIAAGEGLLSLAASRNNEWWTDYKPHSPSLHCSGGEEVDLRKEGKEGWGEGVFKFYFTSYHPTLILLVINSINIPNLNLFYPRQYLVSDLSKSLSQPMNPSLVIFSIPCPDAERCNRGALVGAWCPPRVNPLHTWNLKFYL